MVNNFAISNFYFCRLCDKFVGIKKACPIKIRSLVTCHELPSDILT